MNRAASRCNDSLDSVMQCRLTRTSITIVSKFPRETRGATHPWTVDTRHSSPIFECLGTRLVLKIYYRTLCTWSNFSWSWFQISDRVPTLRIYGGHCWWTTHTVTLQVSNVNLVLEMAVSLKAGARWVNCHNLFDAAAGFGGYRESGCGRDGGKEVWTMWSLVIKLLVSSNSNRVTTIRMDYLL